MADITMCSGEDCSLKYRCYRALAHSHELHQAYFITPPYDAEDGCMYFWDLDKEKNKCE